MRGVPSGGVKKDEALFADPDVGGGRAPARGRYSASVRAFRPLRGKVVELPWLDSDPSVAPLPQDDTGWDPHYNSPIPPNVRFVG